MAERRIRLEEQDEPCVTPRNKLQKLTEEGMLMQAEASSSQVGEAAALKKWLATVRPELPKHKEQMSEEAYERRWEEEDDGKEDWSDRRSSMLIGSGITGTTCGPAPSVHSRMSDGYLELTGPTRAIVLLDPMRFEVELKVKGTNGSEDKDLSILAVPFLKGIHTCVVNGVYSSRLSTLELTFGHLVHSVEATISLKVLSGSWPDGFRGIFAASTASIDDKEVSLLAFEDGKLPVTHDGLIQLSRRVACVELKGELKVSVVARCQDEDRAVERDNMVFTPKEAGISSGILKVSFCEMEVIVAWSLLSATPFFQNKPKKNIPME